MTDTKKIEDHYSEEFAEHAKAFFSAMSEAAKKDFEAKQPHDWDGKPINRDDLSQWNEALKLFNPPKKRGLKAPYVLFGAVKLDYRGGVKKPMCRLHCLQSATVDGLEPKIIQCLKKGMKILDYYFPEKKDLPVLSRKAGQSHTISGWLLEMYNHQEDVWASARNLCEQARNKATELDRLAAENQKQVETISLLQQKLNEAEAKLNGKNKDISERSADDREATSGSKGAVSGAPQTEIGGTRGPATSKNDDSGRKK